MHPATPTSRKITPTPSPPIKRRKVQSGSTSQKGCTILLTGLAKSGKSPISNELTQMLKSSGIPVKQFDGKKMRAGLCKELDLAKPHHRSSFVHLVSEHAKGFTEEGFISIMSIVAPLAHDREKARLSHQESNLAFLEVFVDRPREECERLTGLLRNVLNIGSTIDADYEPPTSSDVHLKPSERSTVSMCHEIVDALVANNIIPQPHIPLMPPPLSPISPMPASPSTSSSTTDSSAADNDDDVEYDEDGNVISFKFKLPRKGSTLLAIFNYCKGEIIKRRKLQNNHAELKNEDVDKDPMFLIMMNEWKDHYQTNVGEDRFFPVLIPQPPKQKTTKPTNTPKTKGIKTPEKKKQDDFIPVYWDSTTIKFGKIQENKYTPAHSKCDDCWQHKHDCAAHSASKMSHFAVLRDANEKKNKYYAAVQQKTVKKKPWTNAVVQNIANSQSMALLPPYLKFHPNYNFTEIYSKSILFSSVEKVPILHTAKLSTALICIFRNIARVENGAKIQPHTFFQNCIDMYSANLEVLERTLTENGITFTVGDEKEEQPSNSPLVNETTFSWTLPYVYCGTESNNQISIGLKVAVKGAVHSNFTHGDSFTSGPLYQTPLTPAQIEIDNFVPPNTTRDEWTPEQVELSDAQPLLREEVQADCRRKEALGITTLVIAQMKGLSRNDIPIIRDNKRYEHINTTEPADLMYIQNVFKFLTGRTLSINVTASNNLSFKGDFFK